MRVIRSGRFAAFLLGAAGVGLALCMGSAHAQAQPDATTIEQGRKLAVAADCAACHTASKGGAPFAGGYPIDSPLGRIYSSNITPSKTAGIGNYTLEEFSRSLRQGIRKDGAHLYPAMPYTSYTQISDGDIAALYAYFMHGVKPVDTPAPETSLPFPFGVRQSMAPWNMLFLKDERFKPDPAKSEQVNRGAYLAGALAHCTACHTPRNAFMAEDSKAELGGGSLGAWYAPNITSDPVHGIGGWTDAELLQYLKTGHAHGKGQAAGPMAEAIENSLQHVPEEDLKAIVAFLRQTPPVTGTESKPRFSFGEPSKTEVAQRGLAIGVDPGWRVFSGSCAHCHQANGDGTRNGEYPSLYHNSATGADRADNLIATILHGVQRKVGDRDFFMPAFGDSASFTDKLTDQEIADVSNYVLTNYGNPSVKVTADDVKVVRAGGKPPLLAQLRPFILPGIAVILLGLIALLIRRRSRAKRRSN